MLYSLIKMTVDPRTGIFIPKKKYLNILGKKEIPPGQVKTEPLQPDLDVLADKIVNKINSLLQQSVNQQVVIGKPSANIILPEIDNTIIDVGVDTPPVQQSNLTGNTTTDQDKSFKKSSSKLRKLKKGKQNE